MYEKPAVERLGTFRELTRQGFNGGGDGLSFEGVDGQNCQRYEIIGNATTLTCIAGGSPRG